MGVPPVRIEDIGGLGVATSSSGPPAVFFVFQPDVSSSFREVTRRCAGKRNLCIIFDSQLVTRPVIMIALSGSGIIEGIGGSADRRMLIAAVTSGRLKAVPVLLREETIPRPGR